MVQSGTFRGFLAVLPPSSTVFGIMSVMKDAEQKFPEYRFVPRQNLHLTLLFLGDVPTETLGDARKGLLKAAAGMCPFMAEIGVGGCFPERGTPRILHCGVVWGEDYLQDLASRVRLAMEPLGYADDKPFKTHITAARRRRESPQNTDDHLVSRHWKRFFDERWSRVPMAARRFEVSSFCLMSSQLTPSGPVYTPMDKYILDQ